MAASSMSALQRDIRLDVLDNTDIEDIAPSFPISIVILIVGSRGDVQPYLALGKKLKQMGHRIRLATHQTFEIKSESFAKCPVMISD